MNLFRALAALVVLVGHFRALFFVDYSHIANPNVLLAGTFFFTGLGHQAVMVFFVLSGFLISASILRAHRENKWSWKWYLSQRLTRLWVVLIPALMLGAILDHAGAALFGVNGLYKGFPPDYSILNYAPLSRLGVSTFLGNMFFLQTILVPTLGSNGALWSLSNEFWYYLLFPCVCLVLLAKNIKTRGIYTLVVIGILVLIGIDMSLYFLIWLLGVLVLLLPKIELPRLVHAMFLLSGLLVFMLTLLSTRMYLTPTVSDFLIAFGFAFLLYTILAQAEQGKHAEQSGRNWLGLANFLAAFSFTLYVVHFPFIVFLRAGAEAIGIANWQPDGLHVLVGTGLILVILGYAWFVSLFTEARTDSVRHFVWKQLTAISLRGQIQPPVAPANAGGQSNKPL